MGRKLKKESDLKPKDYAFINIRFYRKQDYEDFQKLCDENDLTVTRAINGLIKQAIKNKKLPYSEA